MNKIILFFIIFSSYTWAQESFNVKTSHMITAEGYLIPEEVEFIYSKGTRSLKVIRENQKTIDLPLKFLFEEPYDNEKFYLYAFAGDPKYPHYKTLPAVSFYFDKKNGDILIIRLEYYDLIQKKPGEPLQFITVYGIDYIKN